jgi:hypothetical protein
MSYKCEVTGFQIDDSSAEDVYYCGFLNDRKVCKYCDYSEYEEIITVSCSKSG